MKILIWIGILLSIPTALAEGSLHSQHYYYVGEARNQPGSDFFSLTPEGTCQFLVKREFGGKSQFAGTEPVPNAKRESYYCYADQVGILNHVRIQTIVVALTEGELKGMLALSHPDTHRCQGYLDSCEYYRCREKTQPCGQDGYFQRLAIPYCIKLTEVVRPRISPEGQEWMDKAAYCLREQLDLVPPQFSCGSTEDYAIATHTYCYIKAGFCETRFSDKWKVFKHIYGQLTDSRMMKVFLKIASMCGPTIE